MCERLAEFNLQDLVTDGIKRERRRENFCVWMMGSH